MKRLVPPALLSLLLAAAATSAGLAVPDDTCLGCHSSKDSLSDAGPRAGELVVDAKSLKGSVHDGFSCTQCHADLAADNAEIPHAKTLKPVDCSTCHADTADMLRKESIHATRMPAAPGAKSPCAQCHGNHQIRSAKDPDSTTGAHRIADTCAKCHAGKPVGGGKDPITDWKHSVHGRLAVESEVADAPTCAACHKPHQIRPVSDPADPLNRRNRSNVCGSCHPSELKTLLRGVHGKSWAAGNLAAPVCTDCHGSHDIQRIHDRGSRVYASAVSATCGKCHGDPDLTTRFGLRPDRVSTYENSYHGKGSHWKDANVANCASCHRYHDVRAGSDPASPVHDNNLRATCGRPDCHPGATQQFAKLPVHAGAASPGQAALRYVKIGYVLIITLTLAFMAVHQTLDLGAAFRERRKAKQGHAHQAVVAGGMPPRVEPLTKLVKRDGKWVMERWQPVQFVQHFFLATTFLTLCFTGFALEIPFAWAERFGSLGPTLFDLRSLLHRICAVLMIATSVFHIFWVLLTRRGRREIVEMLPVPLHDANHMLQNFLFFLGIRKEPFPGRRYTYKEKLEYWALVWGTIVMVVTGIVLWSASRWPWIVVEVSRIVHTYEAILAFGAIVIWHMFSVQFRPGIFPTAPTWYNGSVTMHVMEEEHSEELQQIVAWHGVDPQELHGHGGKH